MSTDKRRWKATIEYQVTEQRTNLVVYYIDELSELEALVEQGAHFGAINRIVITYQFERTTITEASAA